MSTITPTPGPPNQSWDMNLAVAFGTLQHCKGVRGVRGLRGRQLPVALDFIRCFFSGGGSLFGSVCVGGAWASRWSISEADFVLLVSLVMFRLWSYAKVSLLPPA